MTPLKRQVAQMNNKRAQEVVVLVAVEDGQGDDGNGEGEEDDFEFTITVPSERCLSWEGYYSEDKTCCKEWCDFEDEKKGPCGYSLWEENSEECERVYASIINPANGLAMLAKKLRQRKQDGLALSLK